MCCFYWLGTFRTGIPNTIPLRPFPLSQHYQQQQHDDAPLMRRADLLINGGQCVLFKYSVVYLLVCVCVGVFLLPPPQILFIYFLIFFNLFMS